MGKNYRPELLAPAGSAEGFYGAIHAGADAVYLAGERFGARAYAENIAEHELVACIRYAHLFGRKVYLTVNTLLKDPELEELYDYLFPYYEAGLDAVIVQDVGVLRFVREYFPGLKIHVSTQMTLCSSYGAKLLKSMGASRIVPARELSLGELRAMKDMADIEIEAFIHGAMCYCYSGQCLFSSILGGRSGNRGRCAQPCRLPYSMTVDGRKYENCYFLSLKDMCTIEHIPKLVEAGIDSFKIEGRMKKPEYAAGVTQIYRRYLDRYYELREKYGAEKAAEVYGLEMKGENSIGTGHSMETGHFMEKEYPMKKGCSMEKEHFTGDARQLYSLYIRSEVQDGYLFRRNGREMVSVSNPAYCPADDALLEEIRANYLETRLKLPVTVKAIFQLGQPAEIVMHCTIPQEESGQFTIYAVVKGMPVERALKQPVTEENIRNQLGKLGDSAFRAEEIEVTLDEDCFYPLKAVNELRRATVAELERQILFARGYRRDAFHGDNAFHGNVMLCADSDRENEQRLLSSEGMANSEKLFCSTDSRKNQKGYAISICTQEQAETLVEWLAFHSVERSLRIYVDGDLILMEGKVGESLCRRLSDAGEVYVMLPYILRERDKEYLRQLYEKAKESRWIQGFLVRSMDGFGFLEAEGNTMPCRADAGVYVWNQASVSELTMKFSGLCLPYELNASEQRSLLEGNRGGCPSERNRGKGPSEVSRIGALSEANQGVSLLERNHGAGMYCGRKPQWEKIVYGRIPMMIAANCLFRTVARCRKEQRKSREAGSEDAIMDRHFVMLRDRYHKEFPVVADCRHCINIIYNSIPLSLHKELAKWRGIVDLRIDFTLETPTEVRQVLDSFVAGEPFPQMEYTAGHEKRGVE